MVQATRQSYDTLVRDVVDMAIKAGADEAEVVLSEGDDFSVTIRLGEIETLEQASPRTLGLRVIVDHRVAYSTTSDFEYGTLKKIVGETVAMARLLSPDPANTLPEGVPELPDLDLQLFDPELERLSTEQKIELAMRADRAAAGYDQRITNSEGSIYSDHAGTIYLANSHGLLHSFRGSRALLYTIPLAEQDGKKESAFYVSVKRFVAELKAPEEIGREAARRAVSKLGARKVNTQKGAVIFDYTVASHLWGAIFGALMGDRVYKKMSFLQDKLGKTIGSPLVTLVDDGLQVRGLGSSLLDGEGVPQRRNVLLEQGELRMFTYDTYYANKAGARSTGNAQGGSSIGANNCYLQPSPDTTLADMIRATESGLLVTDMLGSNVNIVTGDYSVGAAGFWIEDGELAYPVHEVTIASHMLAILRHIDMVASDMEVWGAIASPPFRVAEMAIAGV